MTNYELAIAISISAGLINMMLYIEWLMGRPVGRLTLFAPNSRGLLDMYSLSHVIHGMAFYAIFAAFQPALWAVVSAVAVEAAWEVAENTPFIINRYRRTSASEYNGDTLLNSFSDMLFMLLGVAVALFLPWQETVALIIAAEILALGVVRDNLTLNIIMLIHPFEAIKQWQKSKDK